MSESGTEPTPVVPSPEKLHIGGEVAAEGWKILNIAPGDHVDFVGSCHDLSRFASQTIREVYASHVFEHLSYREFLDAVAEVYRVLTPQGVFRMAVPNLDMLCWFYLQSDLSLKERAYITRVIYGGQTNCYDYHKIGLNFYMAGSSLKEAGFTEVRQVPSFGLFKDASEVRFRDTPLSLNIVAIK